MSGPKDYDELDRYLHEHRQEEVLELLDLLDLAVVPKVPTKEMQQAGWKTYEADPAAKIGVYRAMTEASPFSVANHRVVDIDKHMEAVRTAKARSSE
jgi:cephalosporin-C deacetylase-like acetyl esterase